METLEWLDIMRECMAQVWWAWILFVSFVVITGFIIFNLIVTVVCEAVHDISKAAVTREAYNAVNELKL